MQKVTFLLLPHAMASSISLPMEMLNAADNIQRARTRQRSQLSISLACDTLQPVTTSSGMKILPDTLLENVGESDLLVIPGLWRHPLYTLKQNRGVVDWLKTNIGQHRQVCAVGTGSCLLAESGVLHKKPATTHWFYFDLMEKIYPDVQWKRQHLITQAGNFFCAGSINSIADLTVHFIEQGFSPSIARRVESQFSPEIRRAYDSYLFDSSHDARHGDELIADGQQYIRQHFSQTIDFKALAQALGVSSRTFQRRFHKASGYTPLQYQQLLRVNNARDLLQQSNLNIQEIAELTGYVDASHFAAVFRRFCEQTPQAYRRAVRGKLFKG